MVGHLGAGLSLGVQMLPEYRVFADPNGADFCLPPRRRKGLGRPVGRRESPDTLCPSKWWSHGESHPDLRNAIASSCLLDDGPEMERAPGLAPGKSGFASRRLDDFGIARVVKWGDRRDSHPDLLVHSQKL